MFTGIVEDLGVIKQITETGSNRTFDIATSLSEVEVDDSISCNGICLTIERIKADNLTFTAISETIKKTTAAEWNIGDHINLERTLVLMVG